MTQEPIEKIAERLKALVGVDSQPFVNEVERGAILAFVEAVYDDQIEKGGVVQTGDTTRVMAHVRRSPNGVLIAPPTFLRSLKSGGFQQDMSIPLDNLLDGGSEWEYFGPVCSGDKIAVTTRLANVNLRETRLGKMLFLLWEIKYANQSGKLSAIQRATEIRY